MAKLRSDYSSCTSPPYFPSKNGSLHHPSECQAKISSLAFRLGFISSLPLAGQELVFLLSLPTVIFLHHQKPIITLVELARRTIESTGISLFLWAYCPPELTVHKRVYINLLRVLQDNQSHIDVALQRRLRVLLMPITSHFRTTRGDPSYTQTSIFSVSIGPSSRPVSADNLSSISSNEESSSLSIMPPPDGYVRTSNSTQTQLHRKPKSQRLWHVSELSYMSGAKKFAGRSRSPQRSRQLDDDGKGDQENVAPDSIPFRQVPKTQRFGIFMSRKPTMLGSYKRESRSSRPTH